MPPIYFLIKPASGNCNMRCEYCFYHDVAENRAVASYGVMSKQTLENVVKTAMEHAEGACGFMFQGGEPTLAGLDFFRKRCDNTGIAFTRRCCKCLIPASGSSRTGW